MKLLKKFKKQIIKINWLLSILFTFLMKNNRKDKLIDILNKIKEKFICAP